jgi:hypothetical protein
VKISPILLIGLIAGSLASILLLSSFYIQAQSSHRLEYNIASESRAENSPQLTLENTTNLTNNPRDSVYGQVAAWDSNVYMTWQESVQTGSRNYDIFIMNSNDNGSSFGASVNLSNNSGFSEHPQIAAYENNVYIVWADDTPGNREVLFVRSEDNGRSFNSISNLSNNTSDSFNQEIAAFGDNVYVIWLDQGEDGQRNILFKSSADGGATFGRTIEISNNANHETFPKIATYENSVYIVWNVADAELDATSDQGLFFVRSLDRGNTFENVTKLNQEDDHIGEAQITAFNETVYVVSGGLHSVEVDGLFFINSADGGNSFSEPIMIDENGTLVNPLNVEVVAYGEQFAYIAAQVFVGDNEEILLLEMDGNNPTGILNLSNNPGVSECPSIAVSGDNMYIVWEDLTPGHHDILYAKVQRT